MPRNDAVGMNVTPGTRDVVRQLAYRLTGETGKRITMDQAIAAACSVASGSLPATVAALGETTKSERKPDHETS